MSIVPMRKVTICGLASEKRAVIDALQKLGCLHIIPLATPSPEAARSPLPHAERVHEALKFLLRSSHIRHPLRADPRFDLQAVTDRALEINERLRTVSDQRDFLKRRIADVSRWGHFDLPPLSDLAGYRLWFYEVPHREAGKLAKLDLPWQEVGRSRSTRFIVVISQHEPLASAMPVRRTHVGAKSLGTLQGELNDVEVELEDLELERIGLTRYIHLIRQNIARADDAAAFEYTLNETHDADGIFALQAWAPETALEDLDAFCGARGLALVKEPASDNETPPTLMDNPQPVAAGEPLSRFYQIPSPRDWDPSGVLLISFALFFAMILSDAGYGLLILLAALVMRAWPATDRTRRALRTMLLTLGAASVLYGVAAGSYFGVSPPAGSLLATFDVIDVRDFQSMMVLAIGVGVLHVTLAQAASAYRHWPEPQALASLGWIAAVFGGFVAWRGWVGAAQETTYVGAVLIAVGLLTVLIFAGGQRGRGRQGAVRRAGGGLLALARVTQVFGDVLSYLRLFALGLASTSLAITFNDLSAQLSASVGGIGLLLAILIAVIGHTLNFTLAVMGGVVHGLRLNFIEFFHWGLTEEGYVFRPFTKTERQL